MSATAFQRRRRELERQSIAAEQNQVEINLEKLTKDELKELLVAKGIDFDEKAKKDDLIKLLKGEE